MNDGLYRGYIKCTSDKKAAQPFKDGEPLLTLEEAQKLDNYAGVLADNAVLVDLDDSGHAERLKRIVDAYDIKCRIVRTSRGMHFVFFCNDQLTNRNHLETAIGLIADYKYGVNPCYEVLKTNGKEREVLADPDMIQTIPRWLYPKSEKATNGKDSEYTSIVGLSQGSRDETLFKWTTSNCKRSPNVSNKTPFNVMANISKREYDRMFTIINQFVFDEPLPDNEFQKFLSQKTFEEKSGFAKETEKKAKKGGEYRELVMDLREKAKIQQFGKALYRIVDGKYYKLLSDVFINNELIAVRRMEPEKQKAAQTMIRSFQREDTVRFDSFYVGFKNGVMNWRTEEFFPYGVKDVPIFRYFDVNYNPEADTTFVDGIVSDWCQGDDVKKEMLYELAGCCFYSDKPIKKWWAIEGKADTGKSTFLRLLREVIGDDNVGSTPIQNLKDSNAIAELIDKPVNIVDDGSSKFTTDLSNLRRIIQGDDMQVKLLYQNRFTVKIESRMVFVFNKTPRFRDDNDATAKKMLMIGFNRIYSDEEKDTELIDKLITENNKEAFLKLAVDGMKNVLHRNLTFTVSEESKQKTAQIMEESDQFVSFMADTISDDYDWKQFLDGKKTSDVYDEFRAWADAEGYQSPMVRKQFTDRCCKESGATTRKSHGSRFYAFRVPTGCQEGA
jgi:putative DNA primase/helicase